MALRGYLKKFKVPGLVSCSPQERWSRGKGGGARGDPKVGLWLISSNSGMLQVMTPNDLAPIPSAPFDDLDLDRDEDEEKWEDRVMALASIRIASARARLERMGVIDADGKVVSHDLPPDMLPDSDATLETG